jgi:predicted transcriptional regulator
VRQIQTRDEEKEGQEMKSVLISIQPKWVELIASGKKTVEVRKTKPRLEVPFKCYIYCTQGKLADLGIIGQTIYEKRMKVIGEFVCDSIHHYRYTKPFFYYGKKMCHTSKDCAKACLTWEELENYLGDKDGYGWHISDLVIYDKPRKLSEFKKPCNHKNDCCTCDRYDYIGHRCYDEITRPFQSWGYVESEVQG